MVLGLVYLDIITREHTLLAVITASPPLVGVRSTLDDFDDCVSRERQITSSLRLVII